MSYRLLAVVFFLFVQTGSSRAALLPFANYTVNGDYVAAGVGLRGLAAGNITIAGIPAGSAVVKAYLYWGYLEDAPNPAGVKMNFNATPIIGTQIGTGLDTCWARKASYAVRADVTALVPGNGVYALTGVVTGGQVLANGACLVVIYSKVGLPGRTIVLIDGLTILTGSVGNETLSGFTALGPVAASTTFIVGDGQGLGALGSFTGSLGTKNLGSIFVGSEGKYWDTPTSNISAQVGAGSTTATATINSSGDCVMWLAQVFSVSTSAAVMPPPAKGGLNEGTHAGATGPALSSGEGSYGHGGRATAQPCNGCGGGANFGTLTSYLVGPFPGEPGQMRVLNVASQQLTRSPTPSADDDEADIVVPLAFTFASVLALAAYLILLWKKPVPATSTPHG